MHYFKEIQTLGNETRSNIYAIYNPEKSIKNVLVIFNMTYPNEFKYNKHHELVYANLASL